MSSRGRYEVAHDWFPRPAPANVTIGEESWLHSAYAFVHYRSERPCGLRVGRRTGIYVETFFDLGPQAEVEIGDYCTLAGPVITTNGRMAIGNHVLISREVVLADGPVAIPGGTAGGEEGGEIRIGDLAWIGTRAVLLSGASLGTGAIVGAGAVVDFAVPPYGVVAGNPARVVGWARSGRGTER